MTCKTILVSAGVLALASLVYGQAKKVIPILQPQMTVETGSYAAPHGKMGEKPAQPWSATTVGAAVDGKANPAKVATLVGEIIDFSCYLQIGKHGEKHRSCSELDSVSLFRLSHARDRQPEQTPGHLQHQAPNKT